jgi:hypothetical protein
MDNYGTHGTPEVKEWLNRHPRFKVHYVPTSSSWLNLIERWFGELTSKRIRRDSFLSVDDLIAAINEFLAAWNENPRPFVWTATVESIVAKLARCRQTLEQIQPGCTAPKTRNTKVQLIRGHYTSGPVAHTVGRPILAAAAFQGGGPASPLSAARYWRLSISPTISKR